MGEPRAGFPKMEKHAAATYVACSLLLVGCAWFTKDTLFQTPKVTTQDLLGTGKRFSMEDSSERTGTASAANAILRRAQSTLRQEATTYTNHKVDNPWQHHKVHFKAINPKDASHTMELANIQTGISEHEHPVKPPPPPPA